MFKIAKMILGRTVRAYMDSLPPGKQQYLIDQLVEFSTKNLEAPLQRRFFRNLGRRLGVAGYLVEGSQGAFVGSSADEVVMDEYLKSSRWEAWLQALLDDLVFPEGTGTFVDIGANIGFSVIPLASRSAVQCLAFEPEPSNYRFFKANIVLNNVEHSVRHFPMALSNSDCAEVEFEVSPCNKGDHHVRATGPVADSRVRSTLAETGWSVIRVPCARLDTVLCADELQPPIAVKVDTQGSEVKVFQGGIEFLKQVDFLVAELNPNFLQRMGDTPDMFFSLLEKLGFTHGAIHDPESDDPAPGPLEPLLSFIERARGLWQITPEKTEINVVMVRQR